MKESGRIKRRAFIGSASGTTGLIGLLGGLGATPGFTADDPPRPSPRSREEFKKLVTELDTLSRKVPSMPPKDCRFLHLMVRATRARRVLELGTGFGFATIWMGLALEETGGNLTTVEIQVDRARAARKSVTEAGLSSRVNHRQGDAHQILPSLEGPFDFVLLNADKDGQVDYFNKLVPKKLAPGGLLLAYGAIQRGDKMKDYLATVGDHPEFDTVVLSASMEEGFAVSVRRA
jgi:caffeoyl-CoA O-methyltransferase